MPVSANSQHENVKTWRQLLPLAGVLTLGLTGCASVWDEVWSRDFSVSTMFVRPDPMVVLRDSSDGNRRYKALGSLREPLQNGGSQQQQDAVLEVLSASATSEPQPLCRMAALRSLGQFKDPRAAEIIESVYLQNLTFGRDMNSHIRQQCLSSLAETGSEVALRRLILVAKEPPAAGSEAEKQETLDRRLTAVRGLAKFKDPQAVAALAHVLKSEKDIALRDRAHDSLQTCSGKRFPPDSPEWQAYLTPAPMDVQPASWAPQSGAKR